MPRQDPTSGARGDAEDMDKIRISKLLAQRGLCSRREADAFIARGWVYVDGKRVSVPGTRIYPTQTITLDARAQRQKRQALTILLNKPIGYVSGQPEKGYRPAATLIGPASLYKGDRSGRQFHISHLRGLAPAGRLDIDSSGLLVLTQDGRIARRLIGGAADIEKEYLVRVHGTLSANGLALLCHGLALDGKPLKPARVTWVNDQQLKFILTEGKKRQIRHMCKQVGLEVTGLKRVRIGAIRLAKLPVGQWRYLCDDEEF